MALTTADRDRLKNLLGARVTFERRERRLYGHDIAAMPSLVRPLVGDTTPDAVAQPTSEEQLVELVRWATGRGVPLTPRGKGSSGYGGAIPVKKGIVVDLYRLRDVVAIDREALTVTVEPGITWEQLDRELAKQGLTLRLYPTSYPSSSVGGWLAQGGAGIGSYEYGWFAENVVAVRVVLAGGAVRELSGVDVGLVADAEGTTGIISRVTVRVRQLEAEAVTAVACADARDLQSLIDAIIAADLPIWSMVYINPRMAEMKNRSPLREHNGHAAEERVLLPAAYILTLAYRAADRDVVLAALLGLVVPMQAEILPQRIAEHEWQHRFQLMIVKRLGPSLVPSEVVVPLAELGAVMEEIEHKVDQPVVKEGVIVRHGAHGRPEAIILGFIPSDQRRFDYNFVFGLVLTIMDIAARHGGRPYSTGMYFASRADEILGTERVAALREFKREVDPRGVLNPGKVIGSGALGKALSFASAFEPLIRPLGNRVIAKAVAKPDPAASVRGIPADVALYAYSCSQCGYCVDQCDQFYGRGWESQSPRGKWFWLREFIEGREAWSQAMVDTFITCTTCEICDTRCSAVLPIEPSWMQLRGRLIEDDKRMTLPPFEMMSAALRDQGDIWAGYRKDRADWFPEDLWEKHGPQHAADTVYFAGCTASYVERDIGIGTVRLLDEAGVDFTYLGEKELCCATPMLVAGKWEQFESVMRTNIASVLASRRLDGHDELPGLRHDVAQRLPGVGREARHRLPDRGQTLLRARRRQARQRASSPFPRRRRYVTKAARRAAIRTARRDAGAEPRKTRVTWHDSCHIGRASGIYEPPRELIRANPNAELVEMPFNRAEAHCCGSVLTLLNDPAAAADIGEVRLREAQEVGAEAILALCPCCQFQLRVSAQAKGIDIDVVDLAHFSAAALGYELPDPNPEVQQQWAVFEAMIALMTPQGFAELMGSMWPELIDAMPFGMGPMMRAMGRVPGALDLMKPMFPVLFPRLLPLMMPKVMTTMLERIAERVPMPDYMAEQMPAMMPGVMDNLMPHMIGDVVPLVTGPMVEYLQGKGPAARPAAVS